jgi:hypothetical protein
MAARITPGSTCTFATTVFPALSDADAAELRAALALPVDQVQHAMIARVLQARGVMVKNTNVQRHRSGGCSCGRL